MPINVLTQLPSEKLTPERVQELYLSYLRYSDDGCGCGSDCECSDDDAEADTEAVDAPSPPSSIPNSGTPLLSGGDEDPVADIDRIIEDDFDSEDVSRSSYAEYLKYQKDRAGHEGPVDDAWLDFTFDPSDVSLLVHDDPEDQVTRHDHARRQFFKHYMVKSYRRITEVYPGVFALWDEPKAMDAEGPEGADSEQLPADKVQIGENDSGVLIGVVEKTRKRNVEREPVLEGFIDLNGLTRDELKETLKDLVELFESKVYSDFLKKHAVPTKPTKPVRAPKRDRPPTPTPAPPADDAGDVAAVETEVVVTVEKKED
jgi:hypothetical protein